MSGERLSLARLRSHERLLMGAHFDGCHQYGSGFECEACGSSFQVTAERQFRNGDAYAVLWALEGCERCEALLAGARRRPTQVRWMPGEGRPCHVSPEEWGP